MTISHFPFPGGDDRPGSFITMLAGPLTGQSRTSRACGAGGPARTAARTSAENGCVIEVEQDRFEEMVVTALDGLPEELGSLMRNVAVTVEHDAGPPGLLGLYEGIPLTSRGENYAGVLPDRITIYRVAICRICRTEDEVVDQVRRTVIHEVGHHFGIDDDRLDELGW
jgi:predicted Zn-dependent protease with MMP-like domain